MQGLTLYIILGVLVGAVVIFLVVSSILDRKKRKKAKIEQEADDKEKEKSKIHVSILLAFIIKQNELLLKNFVPSVGKIKMSDIRNKSRKAIDIVMKSRPFNFAKSNEEDKEILEITQRFKETNSNGWKKKLINDMQRINKIIKSETEVSIKDEQIKDLIKKIQGVYNESSQ